MDLKIGQNINFRPFLGFSSVFGHDTVFLGRDQVSWSRQFFGRNSFFFVATQFLGWRPSFLVVTACLVATVSGQQLVFLLQLVGVITSSF